MSKTKWYARPLYAIMALALVALMMVPATPVSAATAGTISLDAEWYATDDTVTVTVEDADLDNLKTETQDESSTTPDGAKTVFQFSYTGIEFDTVDRPYDMRGDEYLVHSVSGKLGQITLTSAPAAEATLMAPATPAADMSLDAQPTAPTVLTVVLEVTTTDDRDITIVGKDEAGDPLTETIRVSTGQKTATGLLEFASVDSEGIDASEFTEEDQTVSITCDNFVFADYTYYAVETFEGLVVSSVDADGVTPLMTETGPHTGIFEGTLKLAAATNDTLTPPELAVVDGGTITAKYTDADPVATVTASATVDDTVPFLINQSPADGAKINDATPLISVDVLDFESGVLGTPALGMDITGRGAVSPLQTEIADGYHLQYQLGTSEALTEGTIRVTIIANDIVGNAVDPNSWTFDVDLTAPTMDSAATVTRTTIKVTFSEELDDATVAPGDFLVAGIVTPTKAVVADAVVTLTVPTMPTNAKPTVELVGAVSDLAGNEQTEGEVTAADGVGPTVAIVVSPDPCGAEVATFDLTFSEVMKTSVAPTVKFTDTDSAPPPGVNTVTGGWTTTTTWQGTVDISGLTDQEFESVVTVTGGKDLPGNEMAEATDSFNIDTLVADPTFSPADGATIYTASPVVRIAFSEVVTITAATFDGEDVLDDLTTTNNKTFKLATQDLAAGDHTISVEAEDVLGNTGGPFKATFTVAVALSYDIELSAGWNLISLPLIPDDPSIDAVLSGISVPGTVSKVWAYDAQTKTWSFYIPASGVGELSVMRDGAGYWVEMTDDATLTINGSVLPEPPSPPQSYDVYAGWNLIGCTTQTSPVAPDDYLLSVAGKYTHIWGYDASTGYFVVLPSPPGTDEMLPGMGYWIWMTADGVIVPPVVG